MRRALCALIGTLAAGGVVLASQVPTATPLAVAEALVAAFNEHDPAAMAALVTTDFELFYIDDEGAAGLATRGADQLAADMAEYFVARPAVRSTIVGAIEGPAFVSFREQIVGGQSSLAVFEVHEGKVRRAWYFPAED